MKSEETRGHKRAAKRPDHVRAPAHWTPSEPPQPSDGELCENPDDKEGLNPVRYGDWEKKGIAIDF